VRLTVSLRVIVGYRGADGSSVLHCPEVNAALDTEEDVLSDDYLKVIGRAWEECHQRITTSGVDLNSYTMLDVIEDIEQVRKTLGFEKINLLSASYGTRVAYLYGLKHPNSLHRTIMIGATPPGHFGWEPEVIDSQIEHYARLCASDINCSRRTSDLTKTMKNVIKNMPDSWLAFDINKSKVKLATFISLYHRNEAAKVFDAYIAAENGDPSGLALLTLAYDYAMPNSVIWGDFAAKSYSADFDSKRQYAKEMDPTDSVMGSPLGKLTWGSLELSNWPMEMMPEQYRYTRESNVETLVLSGSVDVSTPAEWASKELAPHLKRGKHIILAELGHRRDIYNINPEVTQQLITNYLLTGTVDESKVTYTPMNFESSWGWPDMAKFGMSAISITALTLLIVL
jgi:pimeloyl-ACP methyl ester carboxylesterase